MASTTSNDVVQMITVAGRRFALLPEEEYLRLTATQEPPLPGPNKHGTYPAVETARVILARKIIRQRQAAGLTQAELARRAGIRLPTLIQLEKGVRATSVATVDKVERALSSC